ncbi:hypothetical protein [Argonema antarcticum]|uniref:hypothetical protein n=1 Tax=Argonema antarcticum TaxID=2942763 RepID=UPI00201251AB|nr:hypothetical protein [Argonema antarcticum]MCL1470172.1 hypothetical protein [Argonema antarcticum A004/B2]
MAEPQLMILPSLLMRSGLQIRQVDDIILFKFTEELHSRLEELLEKSKAGFLTQYEAAELAGIKELDRIFTLVNSKLAARSKWSQNKLEALSDKERETDVNTATLLNL